MESFVYDFSEEEEEASISLSSAASALETKQVLAVNPSSTLSKDNDDMRPTLKSGKSKKGASGGNASSLPLRGVTCLVSVKSVDDAIDSSQSVELVAKEIGAKVVSKFVDSVSHFVFKNGNVDWLRKALERPGVSIVSPVWIERCRELMTRVSESMYLHEITDDDLALLSNSSSSAATRAPTLSNSTKESKRNSRSRKRGFSESESESTSLQDDDIHDEESESIGSNAEECVETTEEDEMSKVHADSIVKEGMESVSSENQDDIVPKKKTSKRHNSAVASDNDASHRDLGSQVARPVGKSKKSPLYILQISGFDIPDKEYLHGAIDHIPGFVLADSIGAKITHLVVTQPVRTLKSLLAVAQGAKIVTPDWVYASISAGGAVDEDPFLIANFREAFRRRSKDIVLFKLQKLLFVGCEGSSLMEEMSMWNKAGSALESLVTACGGLFISSGRQADIVIVGPKGCPDSIVRDASTRRCPVVRLEWFIDSVLDFEFKSPETYLYSNSEKR